MAESECVEGEAKAPNLKFGPDGSIIDPVFLRLIKESRPLIPGDLLKLAAFFFRIPSYMLLAERLTVSALTTVVTDPRLTKPIQEFYASSNLAVNLDKGEDTWEYWFVPFTDDTNAEDPWDGQFRYVLPPNSDVGVLVEEQDRRFFAVAVSPSPAEVPADLPERQRALLKSIMRRKARNTQS